MIIKEQNPSAISSAVEKLKNGEVICFATETVYALACDAANDLAVTKLYQLKKRQPQKPIAIWTKNLAMAEKILQFNAVEKKVAQRLMPGAITLILQKKAIADKKYFISQLLNNNGAELALRIPQHQFSLKLLEAFDGVIAATSANISDNDPAVNCEQITNDFGKKIDLIIDGGTCANKMASTVLKIDGKNVKIIRAGKILQQQIEAIIDEGVN